MDYKKIVEQVIRDPRYQSGIEFGEPRSGHPEGKIKQHIADLEANLEKLRHRIHDQDIYWKLKFLIHVHDTFKAQAESGSAAADPHSHESLARAFASEFTDDADLLNIIQFHDENYSLWKQFRRAGRYDDPYFQYLLAKIQDWDLYLIFTIIDGNTKGKDIEKLSWFIHEVKRYKRITLDETWVNLTLAAQPPVLAALL
jgi:hypothetical protein